MKHIGSQEYWGLLSMLIRSCFFAQILIGITSLHIQASENYLSQYSVDSLIDNSLMEFNSLSDPSNSNTHETVIQNAKALTSKLRSIAKNDNHQAYILSKVGELENQIYLEEHELLLEKAQWKQKVSNEIIKNYNTEIGADRPDFYLMDNLQKQLYDTDSIVSLQMAQSIKKQAESLHRLLPELIEQKMQENNMETAYKELSYCRQHSLNLGFTKSDIARLEAKLLARSSIDASLKLMQTGFDSLKIYLQKVDFRGARRVESLIKYQLDFVKKEMLTIEWNRHYLDWQVSVRKINNKEDSCIGVAEKLFKAGKITETGDLIDTLGKLGIHPEKIAIINRKLLDKIIFQKQTEAFSNIYAFDADTSETHPVFSDLILAAKTRVLADRDSVSKRKEENTTLTQVSEIRRDHLLLSQELQQSRLEARKNSESSLAYDELVAIYIYIEKDSINQARKHFQNVRKLLENNLSTQDLTKLDSSLRSVSSPLNTSEKNQ
jgi:hypothetical protein